MRMSNHVYDIINKIQRWLPFLGIFYISLSEIWGLPYGNEIDKSIMALASLLAATLEISTNTYNKTGGNGDGH